MKNIEMMKNYVRERSLTGQVRELVSGTDMTLQTPSSTCTMPTLSASRHSWLSTSGKEAEP